MNEGRFVLAAAVLSALMFGFGSHVLAKIFGQDLGSDNGFIIASVVTGLFYGVFRALMQDRRPTT